MMNESYESALEEISARFSAAIRSMGEALSIICENVSEALERIKKFFKNYIAAKKCKQTAKAGWYVPHTITLSNQVFNRKPRMAVARSSL